MKTNKPLSSFFFLLTIIVLSGCTSPSKHENKIELTVIGVKGETVSFTIENIFDLPSISGKSECKNSFGNWVNRGTYVGIPLSIFAEKVGGIQPGDQLVVSTHDNYTPQIFTYENVYPSSEWREIQGSMILAYEFNETKFPDWTDGLRIVFLPPDEMYSTSDRMNTSLIESSAAASTVWAKFVKQLEFQRPNATFPFSIEGGSLIGFNHYNNHGLVWNQGFNLTLVQNIEETTNQNFFHIYITNIRTRDVVFSGIDNSESQQILNETCLLVSLKISISLPRIFNIISDSDNQNSNEINFAAIGDTQGFNQFYQDLVQEDSFDFIIHLGDITPFGTEKRLKEFQRITKGSKVPVFSTPGNHDIKESNSTSNYQKYFGEPEYYFKFGNIIFIVLDSSREYLLENSISFLLKMLNKFPDNPKVIITHVPIFDPREGKGHSLIEKSQSDYLVSLIEDNNVQMVLTGHIHYYNQTIRNGTHYVISGGGGAVLYEPLELGGFHHYMKFSINDTGVFSTPIQLMRYFLPTDVQIIKENENFTLSFFDLQNEFTSISMNTSFQNQYYNWRGYGTYIGVTFETLLDNTVGGMSSHQILQVESWDGLLENYSYSVVYPNSSWESIQGKMVLAYSYNDTVVPEWSDGLRIVFFAPDGRYSNKDCEKTSPSNEGYWIYQSAGFRWLKFIKKMTIIGE